MAKRCTIEAQKSVIEETKTEPPIEENQSTQPTQTNTITGQVVGAQIAKGKPIIGIITLLAIVALCSTLYFKFYRKKN